MTPPRVHDPGRIIAHRGASRVAPENTLAAFRMAREQGVRWIEFDVTLLGDGLPVIHHDASLDRCTSQTGPLLTLNALSLSAVDAGARFGDAFRGEPLPTLEATLDLIESLDLYANLELKLNDAEPASLARAAASALAQRDWARSRIVVSSFDHTTLALFRQHSPDHPVAVLWRDPPADWRETTRRLNASGVHMNHRYLRMEFLQEVRREGLDLRVYTINDPDLMLPFREQGLTGVITDHPPLFTGLQDWRDWSMT
ncbi:MAG: glycerophosphodiester phosphodiesterase family protein [Pseudomonadota bacterium]